MNEVHIDISETTKIKALCGTKPNGQRQFVYVYKGDRVPQTVTCEKCIKLHKER